MTTFTVTWKIEAETASDAAKQAREILLDTDSEALDFKVVNESTKEADNVDLLTLPYQKYFNELQSKLEQFDNSIELTSEFSDTAYEDNLPIRIAVENFFEAWELDLSNLTPLSGEVKEHHSQVRELTRPYVSISEQQYVELMKGKADFYRTNGGLVVTFGKADNGWALMPLNQEAGQRVLDQQ
ncbi:hypothetical protein A1QO_02550 [Vibrio genomosp. F10 str. ZF-129]|uniref:Uncharacterized protein n=1 Tax=Vibrio genomosp. F10 str. ZF-129 TaxID=1187848 RepID=A0A1E5BK80_9VIBR|nr:hypothetical protein [Vibrio genomosp. F10]OEE38277.1 hypothetical protein A1QO_02550 [Vibrio genomosp. F10 str. ZF-129]